MFMGFILHIYIIFGTNLLTGGPAHIAVFLPILVFRGKRISNGANGMKLPRWFFLDQKGTRRTWRWSRRRNEEAMRREVAPLPSWAPRSSTDLLLPPIYIHIPRKHAGAPRNRISTTATFCTHEIPSWGLFRRSVGGGIDHGGLLHQHHSLSDEVWVVYFRPSGL